MRPAGTTREAGPFTWMSRGLVDGLETWALLVPHSRNFYCLRQYSPRVRTLPALPGLGLEDREDPFSGWRLVVHGGPSRDGFDSLTEALIGVVAPLAELLAEEATSLETEAETCLALASGIRSCLP